MPSFEDLLAEHLSAEDLPITDFSSEDLLFTSFEDLVFALSRGSPFEDLLLLQTEDLEDLSR